MPTQAGGAHQDNPSVAHRSDARSTTLVFAHPAARGDCRACELAAGVEGIAAEPVDALRCE
jgi:hypothetical protein